MTNLRVIYSNAPLSVHVKWNIVSLLKEIRASISQWCKLDEVLLIWSPSMFSTSNSSWRWRIIIVLWTNLLYCFYYDSVKFFVFVLFYVLSRPHYFMYFLCKPQVVIIITSETHFLIREWLYTHFPHIRPA